MERAKTRIQKTFLLEFFKGILKPKSMFED
jgi:hypothetical protein